jgi:uncharacterized protein YcaQ
MNKSTGFALKRLIASALPAPKRPAHGPGAGRHDKLTAELARFARFAGLAQMDLTNAMPDSL